MATWYGKAAQNIAAKKIDLVNDDIKVMLVSSAYVPNQDAHATVADITGEIAGTGYTAGGKSLAGKTLVQTASSNTWKWDATDLTWTGTTLPAFRYAVIYDNTDASKPLIGYVNFGSNQTTANQDLTIKWDYMYQDPDTGEITSSTGILEMGY